ncbi:DUF4129 domain-containing protein [Rossellomorea vietnamensis]|uniref:DUF4129 domain-containing protein n=1 Tax=Rossellomorea vietnamensis TaxID=218284 RepID=UPI00077C9D8E|nr:DUF4129 domain-containing protein [Rossellomorea vietnamensis]
MLNENRARDQLEEILEGEEYKAYLQDHQGLLSGLWEKAKEWIRDLLGNIDPSLEPTGGAASGILITLIVIVVGILLLIAFNAVRNGVRRRKFRSNKPLQSMNEMEWSYTRHLEEARKHEDLGDYSKATRHMFLALLLYFHEREYLEARVWKTNWEYYEELRKVNQRWADRFYRLALLFDEVAYGEREVEKEEYLHYKQEARSWLENGDS